MQFGPDGPPPAPTAAAPAGPPPHGRPEGWRHADPYAAFAVRGVCALVAVVGALMTLATLAQWLAGPLPTLEQARLTMGLAMLAGGAVAFETGRRGKPRFAMSLALFVAFAAISVNALQSGMGSYSIATAGAILIVAVAGMLVDMPTAFAFAALYLGLTTALIVAESHALLPGAAALPRLGPVARALSFGLLTVAGLLIAWTVRRQIRGNVQRAGEQERRMARLLQLGSDFTWELDARGRVTYLSPTFETHTRRAVAECLRIGEEGAPRPVQDAEWERWIADMKARRPFRDRVTHYVCADGEELYITGSGEPVFDGSGRLTGWWGVSRDATAEMLARRELERSQTMLDRLVRLSPDAICVASLRDGRVLLANPAFLQISGYSEAEVMGRNGVELGLWRDPEAMLAFGRALRAAGWVRDFRSTAWSRDGARHSVLITGAAFDWDGEAVCVMTTRDVTETERAQREGDAILDNAVIGVCLVRSHRLERVNPQLERMLGAAPGSLAGQPTETLFPDAAKFRSFVDAYEGPQAAGDTIDIERHITRPDGTRRLLRLRGRAVDATRRPETGTIWIVEDITERRVAEMELAEAKREAEAASRAKSSFLATMSHEIRTPLSGVLGLAKLLQEPSLAEPQRAAYLGHLVDAAELLNGIVSDVLDLSKIEAGHLQVERIPFDLHAVVWAAFRTFAPLGQERGLEMTCHVDPDAPRDVLGDPVRVRQILSNYLSNALKFTDRGRIAVRLVARGQGLARIEVLDSGIGVSADQRDTLFQPFTQADGSTTRRFGGSGLGLSICRELATLMGGDVGLESDGVAGSCVWVELPLAAANEDDYATSPGALDEPTPSPLADMRVLVAEDNPVNRLIVGAMLARLGAEVVDAGNGAEAVHAALAAAQESRGFDAVLMDLHMPEVDGLEATRRLRALPATAHLPIIALTAAVLEAERLQAQAAGMNGFLTKPAAEPELLRALWPYSPGAARGVSA